MARAGACGGRGPGEESERGQPGRLACGPRARGGPALQPSSAVLWAWSWTWEPRESTGFRPSAGGRLSLGSPAAEPEKRRMGKTCVWEEIRGVGRGAEKVCLRACRRCLRGSSVPPGPPGTVCLGREGSGAGRLGTFIHRLLAPGSQGWPRGLLSAQDAGPNIWSESRDRNGKAHSVRLRWGPVPQMEAHSCCQEPGGPGAVTRATTGVRHADAAPEGARWVVLTEELFLQWDGGLGRF